MIMPNSVAVLLVTCSLDESRRDLARKVLENLSVVLPGASLSKNFALFDNGSTYTDHLPLAPPGSRVYRSKKNYGYWSAINWVIKNRNAVFGEGIKFLYIIESDLLHTSLRPLGECERFLELEPSASCVRTQEFSVSRRIFYNKRFSFLPFYKERSAISLENAVTGDKAWFKKSPCASRIFLSNLHAKLPALNRFSILESVFDRLSRRESFTERDFFCEVFSEKRFIGVLDRGIFHSAASPSNSSTIFSSSWSDKNFLIDRGYKRTREASIEEITEAIDMTVA